MHPRFAGVGGDDDTLLHPGLYTRFDLLGVRALRSGIVLLSYERARS